MDQGTFWEKLSSPTSRSKLRVDMADSGIQNERSHNPRQPSSGSSLGEELRRSRGQGPRQFHACHLSCVRSL